MIARVERVPLRLDEPPGPVNVGVGVHGVRSLHDVFRLPDLWQLHVYGYSAKLTIGGRGYPVRPGSVSLVPPGVEVRFDWVWTALWRVAQLPEPATSSTRHTASARHPAVASAIAHIEANLAQPLAVPEIARVAGVSHNHLTRLFRSETGVPVVSYIRQRRMARARHLLTATTMSIPAIAASIGITDLQAFNKACRRELGRSPRAIRAGA